MVLSDLVYFGDRSKSSVLSFQILMTAFNFFGNHISKFLREGNCMSWNNLYIVWINWYLYGHVRLPHLKKKKKRFEYGSYTEYWLLLAVLSQTRYLPCFKIVLKSGLSFLYFKSNTPNRFYRLTSKIDSKKFLAETKLLNVTMLSNGMYYKM